MRKSGKSGVDVEDMDSAAAVVDVADHLPELLDMQEALTPDYTWSDEEMELAQDANVLHYRDWDSNTFVISGPLYPFVKAGPGVPKQLGRWQAKTNHQFISTYSARKWAKKKYGHIYEDLSRPELGVWAYRVRKPRVQP